MTVATFPNGAAADWIQCSCLVHADLCNFPYHYGGLLWKGERKKGSSTLASLETSWPFSVQRVTLGCISLCSPRQHEMPNSAYNVCNSG